PLFRASVENRASSGVPAPRSSRPRILVGRHVDVSGSTAAFTLDASPGRHVAVLGPSEIGADILHAAVTGLARQHAPGSVHFHLAPLVETAKGACTEAAADLGELGHRLDVLDPHGLRSLLARLAESPEHPA